MKQEIFRKIERTYNNFLRCSVKRPLLTFIILFLAVLTIGGWLFYQYNVLAQAAEPKTSGEAVRFQKDLYQQILQTWQSRDEQFKAVSSRDYLNPFQLGPRALSEARTQELLLNPQVQELLKAVNLYQFYTAKGETFLTVDERARIWQELGLGQQEEYRGTSNQNIKLLSELKKELTPL